MHEKEGCTDSTASIKFYRYGAGEKVVSKLRLGFRLDAHSEIFARVLHFLAAVLRGDYFCDSFIKTNKQKQTKKRKKE